jgi:hypothetical protein
MIYLSRSRLLCGLLIVLAGCVAVGGSPAATRRARPTQAELNQLIPQEKWTETGLNKLTETEQRTLASEITALIGTKQSSAEAAAPAGKDRSQWRKLQRRMNKDEVKKLLGEPMRVSVSRYYESWDYLGGSVTFDSKGRVDFWSEA